MPEISPAQAVLRILLAQAREDGQVPRDLDTGAEAAFLTAGADGLQASVLLGQRSPEQAVAVLDRQLDRIFTTPAHAGTR
ncbi:TetR family transcriptional regulator C-terminal domain-containing protein [Amycolatopsis sp. cmx-4-68]|uniref:TetR family transcriptional regulator C-terminal domain-containing protein n=1 Tax=Amycolatopsis sp. cmx-4-68 TaxID=2790938 RepID=UPI00397B39A9